MYQGPHDKTQTGYGGHFPSPVDMTILLDQIESRFDHCERVVLQMLENLLSRLGALEANVDAIQSDIGVRRRQIEKDLAGLGDRLLRLEDRRS